MTGFKILELRIGRAAPLGASGALSAIEKHKVEGALAAGPLGLDGDEQADRKHHGGPDKAIHAYAVSHLPGWANELPAQAERFRPGAFGENLVIGGASEADICLGDRWRIGSTLVEVSQGRQPCWKLNWRFEVPDMARRVQESGRTGWYFRVIEPGVIAAGDRGTLVTRPHAAWTLTRTSHLLYHDRMNRPALAELAKLPGLPENLATSGGSAAVFRPDGGLVAPPRYVSVVRRFLRLDFVNQHGAACSQMAVESELEPTAA